MFDLGFSISECSVWKVSSGLANHSVFLFRFIVVTLCFIQFNQFDLI